MSYQGICGYGTQPAGELSLLEFYIARNAFSWPRASYVTLVDYGGGNVRVSAVQDNVVDPAVVSGVAPNARSVDPNHAFTQGVQANQALAPVRSTLFNNQSVITTTTADRAYLSNIASSNWKWHSFSSAIYTAARTTGGIACVLHSTCNEVPTQNGIYYPLRESAAINTNTATGRIANGSGTFHVNLNGAVGSAPLNTARVYSWTYRLNIDLSIYSAIPATLAVTGAASAADPNQTMAIIGNTAFGNVGMVGDWAESIFFNREPTAAEDALVLRYMFLRYAFT